LPVCYGRGSYDVQKVSLKPKQFGFNARTAADAGY
jgi:hypothetical protein